MATATYERGDANLRAETSNNIDLSLRKTSGDTTFGGACSTNRINGYIHGTTLDELDGLQLLQYAQQNATFTGIEAQVRQRLNRHAGITLFGDAVRARLARWQPAPASPARAGLRRTPPGTPGKARWNGCKSARQSRVAAFEQPTPGYGMLNLGVSYSGQTNGTPWQVYLKGNNLTDRLATRTPPSSRPPRL